MNRLFTNWSANDGHPSHDELLLFVDGEMPARTNGALRAHLDACWSCRVRTEKIEETISTFIDYRNSILKPLAEPPPHGWRRFDGKLNGLAAEIGKPSILSGVLGTLNRLFSAPRLSLGWERERWDRRRLVRMLSLDSTVLLRATTAVVAIAVLVAALFYLNRAPIVSASEILQRANDAQEQQIHATNQAVIYQKLQMRRKVASSTAEETLTWEVWSDTANTRTQQSVDQQFVEDPSHLKTSLAKHITSPPALLRLDQVLRTNHMNPARPLSAASYEAWRQSLSTKHEEVTKSTLADGHEVLTLKTTSNGQIKAGEIAEASLVVRISDWHPVAEHLRVKREQGDEEFDLTETAYSVVSLTTLDPKIFAEQPIASAPTSSSTPNTLNPKPDALSPFPIAPSPAFASADLEVEVLRLLHETRADLGEQVSAKRGVDGLLHVSGIVDTAERKAEIMRALQPVMNDPAVRIEIQTVAEAVTQQQQQRKRGISPTMREGSGSVTEQQIEINSETIPAAPELRRHFSSDEQVREFAARMVSQSRSAMRHVYAMRRLLSQFSPEQLHALTPEAKTKWLALIRSHARAYQNEAEAIRDELRPIFFPNAGSAGVPPAMGIEITDDASLTRAIEQLFSVASANDSVIRSAFVAVSGSNATSAIASPQFWQAMKNAESLAAKIGAIGRE